MGKEFIEIRKCPVCGREYTKFATDSTQWVYRIHKDRRTSVCSYTCMRTWEKKQEAKETKKKDKILTELGIRREEEDGKEKKTDQCGKDDPESGKRTVN